MADIALTANRVSPVNETEYMGWTLLAGETITRGQAVAIDGTTGKAVLADASTSAPNGFRGIALNGAAAGEAITIIVQGSVYGFDLSGVAYDAAVYLSNDAGEIGDAAGQVSVVVGRVRPMHDGATPTKVLFVNAPAIM